MARKRAEFGGSIHGGDSLTDMNRQSGVPDRLDLANTTSRESKKFVPVDEIVDLATEDIEDALVEAIDDHRLGFKNDHAQGDGKKVTTSQIESGVLRRRVVEKAVEQDNERLREVRKSLGLDTTTVRTSGKPRSTRKQLGGLGTEDDEYKIQGRSVKGLSLGEQEDRYYKRQDRKRIRSRDQFGREKVSSQKKQAEREKQKTGLPMYDGDVGQVPRMKSVLESDPLGPVKPKEVFVLKKPRLTGEEIGEMFEEDLDRKDNRGSGGRYSSFTSSRSDHRDFARMSRRATNSRKEENKRGKRDNDGHAKSGREAPRSKSDKMRLFHRVRRWLSGGKDEQQTTG